MRHRRKRHHKEGLREAEKLFGWDAVLAARLHIMSDLKEEGWRENDRFPENEADYVQDGIILRKFKARNELVYGIRNFPICKKYIFPIKSPKEGHNG